jgi:hypothetical protein
LEGVACSRGEPSLPPDCSSLLRSTMLGEEVRKGPLGLSCAPCRLPGGRSATMPFFFLSSVAEPSAIPRTAFAERAPEGNSREISHTGLSAGGGQKAPRSTAQPRPVRQAESPAGIYTKSESWPAVRNTGGGTRVGGLKRLERDRERVG